MKAPAGLAFRLPLPYSGGTGVDQPAGLDRPQPGLQPAGGEDGNAPEIQSRVQRI